MDKEDGRRLSRQGQHERHKQAVRRHKRGIRVDEIAAALSMGHVTLRVAIKAADQGGVKARAYPAMADRARAEDAEIHWGD